MRSEFTKRIKLDAWMRAQGRCERCSAKLSTSNVEFHHNTECTFGGSNDLENAIVVCKTCHRNITSRQARVIAKSNRQRAAHLGLHSRKRSSFATNRDAPFKKRLDGTVVRRRASSE